MTRSLHRLTPALLLVSVFTLAGCGDGGGSASTPALPDKAINDQVVGVVWVDVDTISPAKLKASAEALIDAIPTESEPMTQVVSGMRSGLDENMSKLQETHDKLTEAGVEGVVVGIVSPPGADTDPSSFLLVKVAEGADPQGVFEAMRGIDADAPAPRFELVEYADGWLAADPGEEGPEDMAAAPSNGTAENAAAFSEMLTSGAGTVPFVFRINESVRQQLKENPPEQFGPLAASLTDAQSGSVNMTFGGKPSLDVELQFTGAEAAEEFATMLNGLLALGKSQMKAQLAEMPTQPEPAKIDELFNKLKVSTTEGTATMSISIGTVESALGIAQDAGMLEQLPMLLMMLGAQMDGGGQMGPSPEAAPAMPDGGGMPSE